MIEESRVNRFLVSVIGFFAVLAPNLAHAQTNLDQGKSAATIFASDCVECHKAARGLAKGKSLAAVRDFLHEHYTTSDQQAAALAAYVMGGRGSEPVDAPEGRGRKPAAERANASPEEARPPKRQAKPGTEEARPAHAKLRRPAREEAEPKDDESGEQPNMSEPENGPREHHLATRGRRKEPKAPESPPEPPAVAHAPAAVVTAPAPVDATPNRETSPNQGSSPSQNPSPAPTAAAPSNAAAGESGEGAPVERDKIPD
jgi:hypothetical protein